MARRPSATLAPTPLRTWREREDVTYAELAKRCGLSERTVLRAAAGEPMDRDTATTLERETGIAAQAFVAGEPKAKPKPKAPAPAKKPAKSGGAVRAGKPTATVHERALILMETGRGESDASVAQRHGVSTRTIERWRADLETDPALRAAHRRIEQRVEDGFVIPAVRAFNAVCRQLEMLAPTMEAREAVAVIEKVGDVLVQARALPRVKDDEEDDGEPSLDREGAAAAQDREAAGARAVH